MKNLLASFRNGFRGIAATFRTERNFKLHVLAAVVVAVFGFWLNIPAGEWIAVLLAMAMVMGAEAMNTGLESLANAVHPEKHPLIRKAKDAGAAAVLIAAIAAAAVGGIVFGPKLWMWLNSLI
ncbi:MAG: diacylglycerol kinase family protein [Verrucomicrobiales bacterium]|nr:diacylglycerol kinase family protein [Verrucomicrobiales bacterium]